MKTKYSVYLAVILFVFGTAIFFACKKDAKDDNDKVFTSATVASLQESESEDAIADKVETDMDKLVDDLESNDFTTGTTKAGIDSCTTVVIDYPDSLHWPKTVTITYDCSAKVNGENVSQTGQVILTLNIDTSVVSKKLRWRTRLIRSVEFRNFTFSTDSSSITVNGTRTMYRKSFKETFSLNKKSYNVNIKDSIVPDLNFKATYGDNSVTFTRGGYKIRNAYAYYKKIIKWRSDFLNDSLIYTGQIRGLNIKNESYTRTILTPLKFTYCQESPYNVVISGKVELVHGDSSPVEISYTPNGCLTEVSATKDGKIKIIERKLGRKFKKW